MLPANRSSFVLYSSWTFESIVSGLRGSEKWEGTDWDHDKLFSRFKDYVLDEERKLKKMLRPLAYKIDEGNFLHTVTGGSRPEMVRCGRFIRLQMRGPMQRTDSPF